MPGRRHPPASLSLTARATRPLPNSCLSRSALSAMGTPGQPPELAAPPVPCMPRRGSVGPVVLPSHARPPGPPSHPGSAPRHPHQVLRHRNDETGVLGVEQTRPVHRGDPHLAHPHAGAPHPLQGVQAGRRPHVRPPVLACRTAGCVPAPRVRPGRHLAQTVEYYPQRTVRQGPRRRSPRRAARRSAPAAGTCFRSR